MQIHPRPDHRNRPSRLSIAASAFLTLAAIATGAVAISPVPTPPDLLLADLGTEPVNGDAAASGTFSRVALGGGLIFVAAHPDFGLEPWITDGTEAGTRLLRDLCAGKCSSDPHSFVQLDGRAFFLATDGIFGLEPWTSDGTPEGTLLVRDLRPGPEGATPPANHVAVLGDRLLVTASDDSDRPVLWISGGDRASTRRLASPLGPPGAVAEQLIAGEGRAWIVVDVGGRKELWTTDGTSAGTRELSSDCPSCQLQAVFEDRLYFRRFGSGGNEPWTSDGSPSGTKRLGDLCAGACNSFPGEYFEWNGEVFFTARETDISVSDRHLWRTDGTPEGTEIALRGDAGSRFGIATPTVVENTLLFTSYDSQISRLTLHRADASLTGSTLVRPFDSLAAAQGAIAVGDQLYFSFNGASRRTDLWTSDGTNAGTVRLATFDTPQSEPIWREAVSELESLDGRVVFLGRRDETGWEPWTSGAEPASTALVRDIHQEPGSSDPFGFQPVRSALAFAATGDDPAIRITDGTPGGTRALEVGPTIPLELGRLARPGSGPDLLYSGSPGSSPDDGLWRSGGTDSDTFPLDDSVRRALSFTPDGLRSWFAGDDGASGLELWSTDGTPQGTGMVADPLPGLLPSDVLPCCAASSSPSELTPMGDVLLYAAYSLVTSGGETDRELWRSDGTIAGTSRVADLCPGDCSSDPRDLVALGDVVLFSAAGSADGSRHLWSSDGTEAGTAIIDGPPGEPRLLRPLGDTVIFVADRSAGPGEDLWSTDGTAAGTFPLHDLRFGGLPSFVTDAVTVETPAGPRVVLVVANETIGVEPWVTDGTQAGTAPLGDLFAGPASSYPTWLTPLPGPLPGAGVGGFEMLVFAADGGSGSETWIWDGEVLGVLADLAGDEPSLPGPFGRVADRLVFSARDSETGREPRSLELTVPTGSRTLDLLGGRFAVTVDWRNQHDANATGEAVPRPFSGNTGFFWFFRPENLELAVKMLDGSAINGHAWIFYAGLSDIETTIRVRDRVAGTERTYTKDAGGLCGDSDLKAFPLASGSQSVGAAPAGTATAGICDDGDPNALCLLDQRFRVEVDFVDPKDGASGTGHPVAGTDETGYFWFFRPDNLELMIKVLDGRPVNGRFWVFYGALSDVEYTIRVTDRTTNEVEEYHNTPGTLCGKADTNAF